MSKVCKYYLNGTCRYGDRCHFLHESYNNCKENYYGGRDENRRNYSGGNTYSRNSYQNRNDYAYNERLNNNYSYQDRSKYTWTKHSATGENTSSSNYEKSYNRYHVDNRTEDKGFLISQLSANDILELIVFEMKQLEERQVWRLTVVSPHKDLGNVPGLEDVSPEEIRYQYYQSVKDESVAQFLHEYEEALKKVAEYCRIFRSKSEESIKLVKKMLQRVDSNDDEMTTDSAGTNTMSSFSFNLNALSQAKSTPTTAAFSPPDQNQTMFASVSRNTASIASDFSFNPPFTNSVLPQPSIFNAVPSLPTAGSSSWLDQNQSNMNSFSFNLNNLQNVSGTGTAINSLAPDQKVERTEIDTRVYSNVEQLSSEILEAFRAKTFKFGHVPLVPPPRELCSV